MRPTWRGCRPAPRPSTSSLAGAAARRALIRCTAACQHVLSADIDMTLFGSTRSVQRGTPFLEVCIIFSPDIAYIAYIRTEHPMLI